MTDDLRSIFAAPRCARAEDLGAYLLGGLSADEALDLRRHADECAVCKEELRELRPVVDALAALPADLALEDEPLPVPLGDRLLARAAADQRRRRVTRAVLSAAAAIVLVVGSVAVTRLTTDTPANPVRLAEQVQLAAAVPGAQAVAWINERPSGTYLELRATNLPAGRYRMWFELADGTRIPMGTFRSAGGPELLRCPGSSDMRRADLFAVGASDDAGNDVLTASLGTRGPLRPY